MAMSTSKTIYRVGYQPLPTGVFVSPFPYSYRYGWDEDTTVDFCLHELELLLKTQTTPEETAAIIIEPVLGEGGYVPAPNRFMEALRELCDKHQILLIIDEVQTGFGRTGKFFAFEHSGVVPDIMVMAKGLGSGVPISGIASSRELMSHWIPGSHGGTYGGGALATAAALATVKTIREEGLVENAVQMGERLMDGLAEIKSRFPIIGDVRGLGLMVGVEFMSNGHPDKVITKSVQMACLERKLILLTCGSYENVIRWVPPLVVNAAQIDEALTVFEESVAQVMRG
jgi:4-aminobutyrate aminotransferase-like enzyme